MGGFRLLAKPIFGRSRKPWAWAWLLLLVVWCIGTSLFEVYISYVQRDFSTSLQKKDVDGFYKNVWRFVGILLIAVPLFATRTYLRQRLALGWRQWLTTKFLRSYFSERSYLHIALMNTTLDNPDQRISEDVRDFANNATVLAETCFTSVLQVCSFSGVLCSISPPLFAVLVVYCLCGTIITTAVFGPAMVHLQFSTLKKEADFRFSLVRVRENAESIAFYRGEEHEREHVDARFTSLLDVLLRSLRWQYGLNSWLSVYDYITLLVPALVIAPRFFSGEVEFGVIAQASMAFRYVYGGMSLLISNFKDMTTLGAEVRRLNELMQATGVAMDEDQDQVSVRVAPGDSEPPPYEPESSGLLDSENSADKEKVQMVIGPHLSLTELSVKIPSNMQVLVQDLSLEVPEGGSLLIMGCSGSGKSSLLRVIAGLWELGHGHVSRQPDEDVFFIPQSPYMPIGTLRSQLLFPRVAEGGYSDDELYEMLRSLHLDDVCNRAGGLDAQMAWNETMSVGEQQRVGFARVFLDKPKMVFLDEATSALDVTNETMMYQRIQATGCSYVSVGHRPSLVQFHERILLFTAPGQYRILSKSEYWASQMAE